MVALFYARNKVTAGPGRAVFLKSPQTLTGGLWRRFRPKAPPLNLTPSFAIRGLHIVMGRPLGPGAIGLSCAGLGWRLHPCRDRKERVLMSTTFDKVAEIIAETCDIPRENIKPESHAINDLEIDSLDFLDIAFAIDKAFGIKLPLEQWTQEVNEGKASTEQYFVLKNLCDKIDELIAAKGA
jgi:acyl carrier protein